MATDPTTLDTDTGIEQPDDDVTLRDEIDAAFEQHATDEVDAPAEQRARDELGRFAPKAAAEGQEGAAKALAPPAQGQPPTQQPQGLQQPQADQGPKAPASWRPQVREKWAAVDPEVKAEVARRESEHLRMIEETAEQRRYLSAFQSVVGPYEMLIRQEGTNALGAVNYLLNMAAELKVGTPASKVAIVANMIKDHGVDLQALDAVLAGQQLPQQQQPQQFRDPRLDYMLQQQQFQAQQRDEWESTAIRSGLEQFAASHEFYADVKETMADLVERANRLGQTVDLEKIYQRACQLDEQVSTILAQRTSAQQRGPSQAVLRAKRAAVSVTGSPNPNGSTVPQNDTVRAAIEAAFDAHQ